MSKPSFRLQVAEEMIRAIEAGTAPWQKPWEPNVIRTGPFNPGTGRAYRGINAWWLDMQGHADPRWMTYRQARAQDAQVRKGEKGTQVEYWKWTERVPALDDDGRPVIGADGKPETREVRLDRPKVFHAVVFNADQIEGLALWQAPAPTFEPVERAERVLGNTGIPVFHDQADRAFYMPSRDEIHLPARAAFPTAYDYYATALHEAGHGTGHDSRLGRTFGPRGSEDYAKEELRAEMAAFLVATDLGLGHSPERHAAYVESWLKALRDDHSLLFQAARDAETIRAWVLEPDLRPNLEQTRRQAREAAPEKAPGLSAEEKVTLEEAAIARMPQANRRVMAMTLSRLDSVDQASVYGAMAGVNWMVLAAERTNAPDGADLADAFQRVSVTDWNHEYSDDPGVWRRGAAQVEKTLAGMEELAGRSEINKELLSVLWQDKLSDRPRKPAWVVPLSDLRNDQVRAFASDPQNSLVALSIQALEQVPARDIADEPSARVQAERRYLDVPFAEKDAAKAAGAKWDRQRKSWYAPEGADETALAKWAPGAKPEAAPKTAPETAPEAAPEAAPERTPNRREGKAMTGRTERIYLAVPFAEKDAAKALGAKWDRRHKSWYVPEGIDETALAKWRPEAGPDKVAAPEPPSPEAEFAAALQANGLRLDGPPAMDGRWHRVPVEGDAKGKASGSYRGFLDGRPAGQIMNYKSGDQAVQWVATGHTVDPADLERLKAEAAARKAEQDREIARHHREVAKRAFGLWQNAAPAPADHPYLARKGVGAEGLRVDDKDGLLVPLRDGKGWLWNLQVIQPDGTKRFLKDGRKTGLMHVLEGKAKGPLLVAEGYATAASLRQGTGLPVAVAFDAGNLEPVARTLRDQAPDRPLVIASDDDHAVVNNPGRHGARKAAQAVGGAMIVPPFTAPEKAKGLTDYNDLHAERGDKAFAKALQQQLAGLDRERTRTTAPSKEVARDRTQDNAMTV